MEDNVLSEFNNEELILVTDFTKVCRVCLLEVKGTPFVNMFFKDKRIIDILSSHLVMEVNLDDFLPQNICKRCSEEILKMCSLIEKCQKADVVLQNSLQFMLQNEKVGTYDVIIKEEEVITNFKNSEENEVDVLVQDIELVDSENKNDERIEVFYTNSSENDGEVIVDGWFSDIEISKFNELEVDTNNSGTEQYEIVEEEDKGKKDLKVCKRQCPTCLKYFTSSRLNQHMKVHTGNVRRHQCPTCLKFFAKEHLERHMKVHTKEKRIECEVCFKIFTFKANLKRHMMIHTGERPHICEICGKAFGQLVVLASHKKTHVSYEQIDPKTGAPSFTCSYCRRTFKRSTHYNVHIKKHEEAENKIINEEDKASNTQNEELHNCTFCEKSYKTKSSLYTHQIHHREKSFLCNECGKPFLTKSALKEHLTMHTGEKPHNCKFCTKSFARVVNLESHMLIHTGIKPHICNTCGKAFTQATHLKYHILTHTGERAYECNYCKKRFALKGNLTVHVRMHTGETPYVCPVCNKGFYDSSSMKRHKKGHEKVTFT